MKSSSLIYFWLSRQIYKYPHQKKSPIPKSPSPPILPYEERGEDDFSNPALNLEERWLGLHPCSRGTWGSLFRVELMGSSMSRDASPAHLLPAMAKLGLVSGPAAAVSAHCISQSSFVGLLAPGEPRGWMGDTRRWRWEECNPDRQNRSLGKTGAWQVVLPPGVYIITEESGEARSHPPSPARKACGDATLNCSS